MHEKVEALVAGLEAAREQISALRNEVLRLRVERSGNSWPPRGLCLDARNLGTVWDVLTDREWQVLWHFIASPNDKRVASSLGTRPQTVRNQLNSISHKLGVRSRVELAILFVTACYFGRWEGEDA
jgi:DNA-binding NarL/FixJ family response regulator